MKVLGILLAALLTVAILVSPTAAQQPKQQPLSPQAAIALALTLQTTANDIVCACDGADDCTCGTGCTCPNCKRSKTTDPFADANRQTKKGGDPLILASDGYWYPKSAWGPDGPTVSYQPSLSRPGPSWGRSALSFPVYVGNPGRTYGSCGSGG